MEDGGDNSAGASGLDSLQRLPVPRTHPDRVTLSYNGVVGIIFGPDQAPRFEMRLSIGDTDTEDDDDEYDDEDDPYGTGSGRIGAVPASEAEIARLPTATAGEVREKDCAVCLESFEEGEQLRTMACPSSHGFHESCIHKWLSVSRLCPLCRFALPVEQKHEQEQEQQLEEGTS